MSPHKGRTSPMADLAREYAIKYNSFPKKTIARAMFKEHPDIFSDIEHARSILRGVLGKAGKKSRKVISKQYLYDDDAFSLDIPEGEVNEAEPFVVPPNIKKLLIVSDFQVPFHDNDAMEVAFEHGYKIDCDAILLNGDQDDFYGISKFVPDITKRRMSEELDIMKGINKKIREAFPDIPIYWKDGNHEERWEKYLKSHAPALLGVPEFELNIILQLGGLRFEYITDKRAVKFGKLNIIHGHELGVSWGVPRNVAGWLLNKAKTSTLCSHFHQISEQIERNIDGDIIGCFSIGCLCDLKPKWRPFNQWSHGFAVVHREDETGNFRVENKKIINYKIRS